MYKRALFVIALLAACGDDDPARHLDGGVTIDSATPMIDAPWEPVMLTITVNGTPQPNIVVHFQNADSSLVATEMTNSTGTASHVMAPGGYVTAIDPYVAPNTYSRLYTFAGVKPGDHLQLSHKTNAANINMTITLPVQADPAITRYVVRSSCTTTASIFASSGSGFQPTGSVEFKANCASADILAASFNSANDVVGYFIVPDQAITANGTLNYASKSYTPPTSRTYTFNNTTALTTLETTEFVFTAKGPVYVAPTQNGNTATLTLPAFNGATGLTHASGYSLATGALHDFFDWGPLATTPFTADIGARKLVDVTDPVFDNATNTLSWTEGAGVAPDADYIDIDVQRTVASNSNFNIDWQMIAPHTGASAKFPTLPAGTRDYTPDADDTVNPVYLVLIKAPPVGYDGIRANGLAFETIVDTGVYNDLASATPGSLALVTWQEPLALHRPTSERPNVLRHRSRR